ncbi:Glycoside hydrolase family 13 protein [Ceratobasidium theobromae]|uniref:Glycoside hydrolase family 13 protein n=1 Tax=Ceratobasidium theobromae TaxID=1582974 RepID=A0A5N5QPM0_9AGAM|nr:Glycoside hydrolase family 13 protein [Ceratobasidium theobromae]
MQPSTTWMTKSLTPQAFKSYCVYQIYPASFADSNGDGMGDLNGIKSKLEYIRSLGTDVVWLSPIYRSPQKDMGYDISDYQDIDPKYGTLEQWDDLVAETHRLDMRLVMDLVVNHTSDQESRSSKSSPKRNWYMWRPPRFDSEGRRKPPNNWASLFGGSAWEWDEATQEYYLHLFVKEQPDLNWDNPEVRQAIWKMMRWWMDKGCHGFRMDVINLISKVPELPDAPITQPNQEYQPGDRFFANGPRVHEYIQEMHREVLAKYSDYFTVGESPFIHHPKDLLPYVLPERKELQMMFQFELADLDGVSNPLNPRIPKLSEIKGIINKWQTYMFNHGGWNSLYLENHDQARSISRLLGFGTDAAKTKFDFKQYEEDLQKFWSVGAKLLAILHTTQGGTVFIFQGEEIGSTNVPRSWPIEEYKDVATINFYEEEFEKRKKAGSQNPDMTDIMDGINRKARDNARVPMQWDDSTHAGFTTSGNPWMRVNDNYKQINVKSQVDDQDSVLSFWKKMIHIRKGHPLLVHGEFVLFSPEDEHMFAYTREHDDEKMLVLMNFSRDEITATLPTPFVDKAPKAKFVIGNVPHNGEPKLHNKVQLKPFEGQVWSLTP